MDARYENHWYGHSCDRNDSGDDRYSYQILPYGNQALNSHVK